MVSMTFLFLLQWAHLMYSNDIKPWIYICIDFDITLNEMEGIFYDWNKYWFAGMDLRDKSVAIVSVWSNWNVTRNHNARIFQTTFTFYTAIEVKQKKIHIIITLKHFHVVEFFITPSNRNTENGHKLCNKVEFF